MTMSLQIAAMTERLCEWDKVEIRGKPTQEYLKLYEEWGRGAIGKLPYAVAIRYIRTSSVLC